MKKGDRVIMSRVGQSNLVRKWTQPGKPCVMTGYFISNSRKNSDCIWIHQDLHKYPSLFHRSFWELLE